MSEQAQTCPTCGGQWVTTLFEGSINSFYSVDYQCDCNVSEPKPPKWLDIQMEKFFKESKHDTEKENTT